MKLIRAHSKLLGAKFQAEAPRVVGGGAPRLASASKRGLKRLTLEEQGIVGQHSEVAGGFVVESVDYIKEFDITLVQFKHPKTGAYVLHIDTDDTNNAFGVVFRTPAKESTGIAHILEHIVLCGSEKYPVRDPFFKMLKRSMNTYMNAMTAQDYTTYPFSTVVEQDYHNLMDVYLDATFFPLIKETDFWQEGHRLEFAEGGVLKRTGVVYNEMKGHLSDASSLFLQRLQDELFGDTVFGHNSGGDWKRIPQLTYKHLVDFHKSHYHPSNALFFTYGDLPITSTLEHVNSHVLSRFSFDEKFANEPLNEITQKIRFPSKKDVEMVVPAETDTDDKLKVTRAWTINDFNTNDYYHSLVGRVLSSLLLDGAQAPVYASLIDAQVAPTFAPSTGLDLSYYTPVFTIGAQGMTDAAKAETAIWNGVEKAASEGFPEDRVAAVVHQLELSLRHKKANFGLMCVYSAAGSWVHGGPKSLTTSFQVTKLINQMKQASTPDYWKSLTEKWVVAGWNGYQVRLLATPSNTRSKEDLEWEQNELRNIQLTDAEKQRIEADNSKLTMERETPEDLSLLPTLDVSKDVPLVSPEAVRVALKQGKTCDKEIQEVLDQKTNGITYMRGLFDFTHYFAKSSELSQLKSILPMMCQTIGSVDAGKRNYRELDLALERTAGTLNVSPIMPVWLGVEVTPKHKQGEMAEAVLVTLDCLTPNASKAYEDILVDVLTQSNFLTEEGRRLQALLGTWSQSLKSSLTGDAAKYAKKIARAPLSPVFHLEELYSGYTHVKLVQKAAEKGLEGAQKLGNAMQVLSRFAFSPKSAVARASFVDVGGVSFDNVDRFLSRVDDVSKKNELPSLDELRRSIEDLRELGILDKSPVGSRATYLSLPVPVHYCSAVIKTDVKYGHVDDAAMTVLAQLASYDFLHQHVREKGGAYGSGASLDSHGFFGLSSFWDPNSVKTLETFDAALKWLCEAKFTEKQVDEALLSIFGSLDAPQNPSSKGMSYFTQGITPEMRDAQREKYFDLLGKSGIAKLRSVAEKHLANVTSFTVATSNSPQSRTSVCVAGKQDTAEQVFSKMEGWSIVMA